MKSVSCQCTEGNVALGREERTAETELYLKTHFIVPTDAHYYKNHRMLKQFKIITLAPTCLVHAGTIIREQFCA